MFSPQRLDISRPNQPANSHRCQRLLRTADSTDSTHLEPATPNAAVGTPVKTPFFIDFEGLKSPSETCTFSWDSGKTYGNFLVKHGNEHPFVAYNSY